MKRILKILALVLLLLLGLYLFFRYVLLAPVEAEYLKSYVPQDCDYVMLVDSDRLLDMALRDALFYPSEKKEEEEDDDEEDNDENDVQDILKKGYWEGLRLPKELVLFGDDAGVSFLLPIRDVEGFKSMLANVAPESDFFPISDSHFSDSSLHLLVSEDHLRLHWSKSRTDDVAFSGEQGNFKEIDLKEGCLASGHFAYEEIKGDVEIKSGAGQLNILVTSQDDLAFRPTGQASEAPAFFTIQLGTDESPLSQLLRQKSWLSRAITKAGLDPVALEGIWDGRVDLAFEGLRGVEEESVSYSYNDDFEKVEIREVSEHLEGDFELRLGLQKSTDSLFYHRAWVKQVEGEDLLVSYPLQEVLYHEKEDAIVLQSRGMTSGKYASSSTEENAILSVDMTRMRHEISPAQDSLLHWEEQAMERLLLNMPGERELHLTLTFKERDRQGLFSLLGNW